MRFEDFDILINKGFMNNTKEFDQYIRYGNIRANMQRLQILGNGQEQIVRTAEKKLLDPVVQKHNELRSRRNINEEEIITVDDVLKDTAFTPAPPQHYFHKERCLKCGRTWTIMSESPKDEGLVKEVELCTDCRYEEAMNSNVDLPF